MGTDGKVWGMKGWKKGMELLKRLRKKYGMELVTESDGNVNEKLV